MSENIYFVRYGGLSSVRQRGYNTDMPTFHSPPVRRGIYAFVQPYIEYFLLGKDVFDHRRMEKTNNDDALRVFKNEKEKNRFRELSVKDRLTYEEKIEKENLEDRMIKVKHVRPKKFRYAGNLWHHLDTPNSEVIQRKGGWVKTSFLAYKRALFKEVGKISVFKKRTGYGYSYDHLEVFIEKL